MKTAISIPDDLFRKAEKAAKRLGIPRSQLFAKALEDFLQVHDRATVTGRLNRVYLRPPDPVAPSSDRMSVELLRESLKYDTW
jgi:Ribbon-helix-helix domain